ncbi:hypothetical protein [Devosia limi]|uniref:Uncharacterized protein n=1 Tax=Devosia limi DSM 17137 TaxID=1121477 RepID=A0A1M4VG59_9HYPH|nr:hypothetical protein [Devosia limi]SHE68006.1 hypothetical protein SAMN02745223_00879 [Devosia limi DSM 17137]
MSDRDNRSDATITVRLKLGSLDHLFGETNRDPLVGPVRLRTGVETLHRQLAAKGLHHAQQSRLVLEVPASEITPGAEQRLNAAMDRYCEARIDELDLLLEETQLAGRQALWLGLGFLGVCLSMSSVLATAALLPSWLNRLFSEGFVIAGWVGLWRPIELLLYDAWPYRRTQRMYEAMRTMPVVLEAETPPDGRRLDSDSDIGVSGLKTL